MSREYIRVTIGEPFPLFYSHVGTPSERRPETAKGPFYQAGLETLHSPMHEKYVNASVLGLRADGWTVQVDRVRR